MARLLQSEGPPAWRSHATGESAGRGSERDARRDREAPGRVREQAGPHGLDAPVGRVRRHDGPDRRSRRCEPAPAPASRPGRSRRVAPGLAPPPEGRPDTPTVGDTIPAAPRGGRVVTELGAASRASGPRPGAGVRPRPARRPLDRRPPARRPPRPRARAPSLSLPTDADTVEIRAGERAVRLTNLRKVFWPELGVTKRDLLQYDADVAPVLLPHLRGRAMVMKRYPNGASQPFFFMKRVPEPHPPWLDLCPIEHVVPHHRLPRRPGPALAPLGGQSRLHRPQSVVRPLRRRGSARLCPLRSGSRYWRNAVRLTVCSRPRSWCATPSRGSACRPTSRRRAPRGFHVYVPIVRGPTQKDVWDFAKRVALALAGARPALLTAEYRIPEAAGGARPGRLQPEGRGQDAGVRLFGPASSARARCRRPSRGTRSRGASGSRTSTSGTFPRACGRVLSAGAAPRRQEAGAPPARVLSREGAAVG